MLTCIIKYHIDPTKRDQFCQYARNWGQAIPRCGADLIGYYAPHEGSSTLAYGIYNIPSLADYEAYRARLTNDPLGQENYAFAQSQKFLLREERTWLKLASGPHAAVQQHPSGEPT
ncbi:MAG: NIPSNAP family protein [Paracoccaceae bacterium]